MFKKWLGKRAAREQWDAGLAWFRLRYLTPDGPTRCIKLLSRPQACGRVALYFLPGEAIAELYLGIPETHVRLLQRMAADFGFPLRPKPPETAIPAAQRLTAVSELPWERPFMAHVVNECAFVSLLDGENKVPTRGAYLPQPPSAAPKHDAPAWRLPNKPSPGLTAQPYWNGQPPPAHLVAVEPDPRRWLLGRSQSGLPLHVAGRINIYGRQEAVADWLVQQVTQMVSLDHTNLVVIDGAGDLVPRLKRKAAVTRLLGEQLAYVDIDGASLVGGFNPLAATPGETETALLQRWQRWFQGMSVHSQGVQLLVKAREDGVGDIPSLQKWLKQVERQGHYAAVSSLKLALNRLTAGRLLREWVMWPTNPWSQITDRAMFFSCKGGGWERHHLLRAVLLAAVGQPDKKIIVHGFPWSASGIEDIREHEALVIGSGPPLAEAATVLVQSDPQLTIKLGQRFLDNNPLLVENLHLLQRGEGILVQDRETVFTTWLGRPGTVEVAR
jgi:hypothetical protein